MVTDVNGQPIDPIWAAEFRGLFYGEGCISACYYRSNRAGKTYTFFRLYAKIALRNDDLALLQEIQSKLGGYLCRKKNGKKWNTQADGTVSLVRPNPGAEWVVTSRRDLERVVALLEGGRLPARKAREVKIFKEALAMIHARGHKYSEQQRQQIEALIDELRELKRYTPPKVTK